jgi:virulence-associated protein VapD
MSTLISFLAYPKTVDSDLLSLERFTQLLQQYSQLGYRSIKGGAYPHDNSTNSISSTIAIEDFLTQIEQSESFISRNFWQEDFEFSVDFDNATHAIWSVATTYEDLGCYSSVPIRERSSQMFVDAIKTAVELYDPYYGCVFNELRDIPDYPIQSQSFKVTEVYEINFYSWELMQSCLNRELLLSAPAWRVEELSSGILLVPSWEAILGSVDGSTERALARVAEHLKLR